MVRVMLALVRPWSLYTTDYIYNIMNCMLFLCASASGGGRDGLFWFCVADKRNPIAGSRGRRHSSFVLSVLLANCHWKELITHWLAHTLVVDMRHERDSLRLILSSKDDDSVLDRCYRSTSSMGRSGTALRKVLLSLSARYTRCIYYIQGKCCAHYS